MEKPFKIAIRSYQIGSKYLFHNLKYTIMPFISQEELDKLNFKSLEDLQAFLNKRTIGYNNEISADFEGISPNHMSQLLYHPFDKNPIFTIHQAENNVFDKMPFYKTVEHLLQIVLREGVIKLTPKGNLPLKVCEEIANMHYWKEELSDLYKQRKEEDFQVIHTAKIIAHIGGLTRKANGKLNVTKNAQKHLEKNDRNALFLSMFEVFVSKFNWGYHDLYESQTTGQIGWAFTLFLLHKYGNEPQLPAFYAEKYIKAFPFILQDFTDKSYSTPQKQAISCYCVRSFSRYFNWWGFIRQEGESTLYDRETIKIQKTDVFDALFSFKLP